MGFVILCHILQCLIFFFGQPSACCSKILGLAFELVGMVAVDVLVVVVVDRARLQCCVAAWLILTSSLEIWGNCWGLFMASWDDQALDPRQWRQKHTQNHLAQQHQTTTAYQKETRRRTSHKSHQHHQQQNLLLWVMVWELRSLRLGATRAWSCYKNAVP